MYWFKNAIIYQLTKQIDFENIEKQLKECEFTPCSSADVSHFGWSAPLATSENLAHQANGKILLVAKREEKIFPVEVVNRELNKRITAKDVEDEDIIELAKNGSVSKLALEWEDNLKFVLIEDGTLERLKFDDNITEKNGDIVKEDVKARFDADFVLMVNVLGKAVDSLIKEFGGIRDRL